MPQTLAEYIKTRRSILSQICGFEVEANQSLIVQAEKLRDKDANILLKSENNFQISEEFRSKNLHLQANFKPFLAEPLLREGSLLLDRCLQQRREYQELKAKWFEACVQVDELFRLNEITDREEKENYEKPIEMALAELNAVKEEGKQITNVLKFIKDYLTNTKAGDTLIKNNKVRDSGRQGQLAADLDYQLGQENGRELLPFNIQEIQQTGFQVSNSERIKEAEKNLALKESLAGFQKERNNVARIVALRRAEALAKPLGALNFREQMEPIENRFKHDLAAAWLRLSKAAEGFQKLYEYPLDKIFLEYSPPQKGFDFDDLVTWCQNTNTWLASFLDTQQQVTCSFSLNQLLKKQGGNINDGFASGKWQFKLNEEHFYNSKFVRLRGFSIQIDSGHFTGSWNIAITPPTKAKLRNEKEFKDIDQSVGRLYLGRVNETTYQVVPESAAPPKLYNASPIGQDIDEGNWTIEVLGFSTNDNKPSSSITDIDIHLTVALV